MSNYVKKCTLCKKSKPGFEFYRNMRTYDLLTCRCKACVKKNKVESELEMIRRRFPEPGWDKTRTGLKY